MIENQTDKKVKRLWTDNRMQFYSNEFNAYGKSQDIVRHYVILYTPQYNDIIEHWNGTIISKTCCMLSNSTLNRSFYTEVAFIACCFINRSLSITIGKKTPIEKWFGSLADYS